MRNEKHNRLDTVAGYLRHKAAAARRPFGKYLARQESRMGAKLHRRLKAQMRWIISETEGMTFFAPEKGLRVLEKKTYYDEIDDMLSRLPFDTEIIDDIVAVARPTYKKGVSKGIEELDLGRYGISFSLVNDEAVAYLENIRTIQLSDFRGTISRTTKDKIQKILIESAETGRSYTETSKLIREQGAEGVFSRARGELIAVNQVGAAFGEGNRQIVDSFRQETGQLVQKFWQTVEDDRVTPECEANQDMGWIGFDESFASGDEAAPRASNPRCRCATSFRTVDTQGNPT